MNEEEKDVPPKIEEILRRFNKAMFFTSTDGTVSYWQIPIRLKDQQLCIQILLYVFLRTPFGLMNSGATLIRGLNKLLEGVLDDDVCCYIDDTVVATKDFEGHLRELQRVLKKI